MKNLRKADALCFGLAFKTTGDGNICAFGGHVILLPVSVKVHINKGYNFVCFVAWLGGLGLGCGLVMLVHVILIQSFFPTGKVRRSFLVPPLNPLRWRGRVR